MLLSTAKLGVAKPDNAWVKSGRAMNLTYTRLILGLFSTWVKQSVLITAGIGLFFAWLCDHGFQNL